MSNDCFVDLEGGRTKITRDLVRARLLGRGFPLRTAERVTDRIMKGLADREDTILSAADLEEAIELQARASLLKAWRLGGAPTGFFQQAPPTPVPPPPVPAPAPWWAGPAVSLGGQVIIQSSKWLGDDVPPKLHGITQVSSSTCCEQVEKGIEVTVKVDAEEIDDWGWTGGIDRITVAPVDSNGRRAGKTGETSGGSHIGRKEFEVKVCIPCSAIANGRAFVEITVEDGSGNSVRETHSFPVKQEWIDRCCK